MRVTETTWRDDLFGYNLKDCRKIIFNLRFKDVTAMCGIPQSTMQSYERTTGEVHTPTLTAAKLIADMYCTDLDSLCAGNIRASHAYVENMQKIFISRLGPLPVPDKDVAELTPLRLSELIAWSCRHERYYVVPEDTEIGKNFTRNLSRLMDLSHVPYKAVETLSGVSAPTLTRLKQGSPPSFSSVIRLSEYFGVTIGRLTAKDPGFSPEELINIIGRVNIKAEILEAETLKPRRNTGRF